MILTIPLGLRFQVGADYSSYVSIYNTIKEGGIFANGLENLEFGYKALNYLTFIIFNDVQWVFIVSALITNFFHF